MHHKRDFIFLVILNILDILSTIYFLEFDIFSEGNPLALYLLDKMGYIGLVLPKVAFLGLLGFLLMNEGAKDSKFAKFVVRATVAIYTLVVIWNIGSIALFYAGLI